MSDHNIENLSPDDKRRILQQELQQYAKDYKIVFWVPYQEQEDFIRSDNKMRMFVGGNRIGKCLPLYSPVLMADGTFRQLGEIKQGDTVIGVDYHTGKATPTEVLGISRAGKKQVYKVTFKDGGSVIASEEHEFPVFKKSGRDKKPQKVRLRDIIQRNASVTALSCKTRFIQPSEITYSNSTEVPIPPYTLGALLGDGSLQKSLKFSNTDTAVLARVSEELKTIGFELFQYKDTCDYSIRQIVRKDTDDNGQFQKSDLRILLENLGLFNTHSHTKFIPHVYKTASIEDRLALVAGLIDTDGSKNEFSTASKQLADDIADVIKSLGGKANYTIKETSHRVSYRIFWRLNKQLPLQRKDKQHFTKRMPEYNKRVVTSIEPYEITECGDIWVAHHDHCFVSWDYIVTGNTESGIVEDVSFCLGYRPFLKENDPDYKTPFETPVHGLITTESLGSEGTAKKVIENKLNEFIPKSELKSTKKNQQGVTVFYEFNNGSTLSVMAYEQDVEKFEGSRYHFWHGDEPPPKKLYGAIQRGLVDYNGYTWITMTPVASESFTIELFNDPDIFRIGPLPITVNLRRQRIWNGQKVMCGYLTDVAIEKFRRSLHHAGMDPAEIEARLSGAFKALSGRILPFDASVHVCEPFRIESGRSTLYLAIDPHPVKPWAISFMIATDKGELYTIQELDIKGKIEDIAAAICSELDRVNMEPKITIIDPQAIVNESDTENLIIKLYRASNHRLKPQKAARGEAAKAQGIQLWRQNMDHDVNKGEFPRWHVFSHCVKTIRQANSWVYDDTGRGFASKEDDDMCENHYRLFNLNPSFAFNKKDKSKTNRKIIHGIGQQ